MRSTLLLSALCGLSAAAPRPQGINIEAANNLEQPEVLGPDVADITAPPVAYDPTSAAISAASAISTAPVVKGMSAPSEKRAEVCEPEPAGSGPVPGDGSVAAYLDLENELSRTALSAGTPEGYAKSFTNLQASTQQIGYLTFQTLESGLYDVDECASFCNDVRFCMAFNIYYERDPSVNPGVGCANPPPVTNVKCSLYGYPVAAGSALNNGQWRGPKNESGEAFHEAIAGSNGYSKTDLFPSPPSLTNFTGPSPLLPGAINAPLFSYMGMKLYNSGPYDPSLCAAACQAQTAYDRKHPKSDGSYMACNFFNSYILAKNGVPLGSYCSFYTQTWNVSYATNFGYSSKGDHYQVLGSFSYELTNKDPGHI